jgi:hypothetical protein
MPSHPASARSSFARRDSARRIAISITTDAERVWLKIEFLFTRRIE